MKQNKFEDIDSYIKSFPANIQNRLKKVRSTIRKAAPDAQETISYQMPAFTLNGNLVYFAAFKNHIGFYPAPRAIEEFKEELSAYKGAKGSIQFPLDKDIPTELISKIVQFRVKQNMEKAKTKSQQIRSNENPFSALAGPARRALENKGIKTLEQLAKCSEAEMLQLHGMGPGSIPKLRTALQQANLSFSS